MTAIEVKLWLQDYFCDDMEKNAMAFKKIYFYFYPMLFNYASHHLDNAMDVEDLVQDLFAAFWKGRWEIKDKGIDSKELLQQYFIGKLTGQIANFNKRKSFVEEVPPHISLEELLTISGAQIIDESVDDLELKEYWRVVEEVVLKLEYPHRNIFNLLREKKYTIKDTSRMLGMTPKSVSKYLKEAIAFIHYEVKRRYS